MYQKKPFLKFFCMFFIVSVCSMLTLSNADAQFDPDYEVFTTDKTDTFALAWGDWDNDDDLDLAVGNNGKNQIFENQDGKLFLDPENGLGWESSDENYTSSLAWGDWDGDGDLDLAVGNTDSPIQVYENDNNTLNLDPSGGYGWVSADYPARSIDWGDWDGDGDLDLAADGRIFENSGSELQHQPESGIGWIVPADLNIEIQEVAWVDWDNDGDLDFSFVSKENIVVFENNVGSFNLAPPIGDGYLLNYGGRTLDWGDWDNDGDLDLAVDTTVFENEFDIFFDRILVLDPDNGFGWGTPPYYDSEFNGPPQDIEWGDWDSDGDLDLAVARAWLVGGINSERLIQNQIYENSEGQLLPRWESPDARHTTSLAWGDLDNDGDLDLATGNSGWRIGFPSTDADHNQIYLNESGGAKFVNGPLQLGWESPDEEYTSSMAWGDWDGDGDLDLAVSGGVDPRIDADITTNSKIFENDNGSLVFDVDNDLGWEAPDGQSGNSVAWGDWDSDGDLDLAIGSLTKNRVFENENGTLVLDPANGVGWESFDEQYTQDIAWGDWDNDGDLDLAVGNYGVDQVFENEGGTLVLDPANGLGWVSPDRETFLNSSSSSVSWGDWDSDSDLDLAVTNSHFEGGYTILYENIQGTLVFSPTNNTGWISSGGPDGENTDAAWGDWDGDGDKDIAIGNWGPLLVGNSLLGLNAINSIWEYDGNSFVLEPQNGLGWQPHSELRRTEAVAFGDWDNDGDLDLATGNSDRGRFGDTADSNEVWENRQGTLKLSDDKKYGWASSENERFTTSIAWADWDGDGDQDLAVGNALDTFNSHISSKDQIYQNHLVSNKLYDNSLPSATISRPGTDNAFFHSSAKILTESQIEIPYKLYDADGDGVRLIKAYYSTSGGGQWFPAVATEDTQLTNLATGPTFSGESHTFIWDTFASGFYDSSDSVTIRFDIYGNRGSFQQVKTVAYSSPFRVRGTTITVYSETVDVGQEQEGAIVYRLPQDGSSRGTPYQTTEGESLTTRADGALIGVDTVDIRDRLIAILPITTFDNHTLYHTSATPNQTDVDSYPVTEPGPQNLVISASNPLAIFDLSVSLEWDASNDELFLLQLESNLNKASDALYDWSNGQVALGDISVYQAKERWEEADIRVYATNQIRPSANRGGVVEDDIELTDPRLDESITAAPGQVRIGSLWNRYGDLETIGDDWANVLAHELGHYLLFLEDTYLGIDDETGLLIPVDTCTGTAMSDPYEISFSEFLFEDGTWGDADRCGRTLAELPDWELITLAYPDLIAPTIESPNSGPAFMPLSLMQMSVQDPPETENSLLVDDVVSIEGAEYEFGAARGYLLQNQRTAQAQMIELGRPIVDTFKARGAREGDELCILGDQGFGCTVLSNDTAPTIDISPLWDIDIQLTPINTTTLQIFIDGDEPEIIDVYIYPAGGAPQLAMVVPGVVATVALDEPSIEALVDVQGNTPEKRIITRYSTGSGPGRLRGHDGPGRLRGHDGPLTSGDGSVVIYPPVNLDDDTFISLQVANNTPEIPTGLAKIGQAYYLRPSSDIVDLSGGSIAIYYLGTNVQAADIPEENLKVYYYDESTGWQPLNSILNKNQNIISAPLVGSGLYALMSSYIVEFYGPGWDLIGYPLQQRVSVIDATQAITGQFTSIYGYYASDTVDPWKLYDVNVAELNPELNDLEYLEPGRGYWIYATESVSTTWPLSPPTISAASMTDEQRIRPSTFYGQIVTEQLLIDNAQITAWIDDVQCGTGVVMKSNDKWTYMIDVLPSDKHTPKCGQLGQSVALHLGTDQLNSTVSWNNELIQRYDMGDTLTTDVFYLPIFQK